MKQNKHHRRIRKHAFIMWSCYSVMFRQSVVRCCFAGLAYKCISRCAAPPRPSPPQAMLHLTSSYRSSPHNPMFSLINVPTSPCQVLPHTSPFHLTQPLPSGPVSALSTVPRPAPHSPTQPVPVSPHLDIPHSFPAVLTSRSPKSEPQRHLNRSSFPGSTNILSLFLARCRSRQTLIITEFGCARGGRVRACSKTSSTYVIMPKY